VRSEIVDALRDGKALPGLAPDEAAVVHFGREFFRTHRNNVVHNGYVPTEPEVMAYGDRVLAYIDDRLDVLDRTAVEGMNVALARRIQGPPLTEPGYLEGRIFIEMVLSGKERPRTFGAAIDEIRERRPRAYLQSGPT
jgi:hypothetical protein